MIPTTQTAIPTITSDQVVFSELLHQGQSWSWVLRRGHTLRLQTRGPGANVALWCAYAVQPLERLNIPDSLKAQHIARFTAGSTLMSDMGRVLLALSADSLGWHDPLCGVSDAAWTAARFGATDYQHQRNARYRNGRDNMIIELGKHGLGERDLGGVVNCFSRVMVDGQGRLRLQEAAPSGSSVDLRAEMDVLVALSNTPHPLHPGGVWQVPEVDLIVWRSGTAAAEDPCRLSCPENTRAYQLTERLYR